MRLTWPTGLVHLDLMPKGKNWRTSVNSDLITINGQEKEKEVICLVLVSPSCDQPLPLPPAPIPVLSPDTFSDKTLADRWCSIFGHIVFTVTVASADSFAVFILLLPVFWCHPLSCRERQKRSNMEAQEGWEVWRLFESLRILLRYLLSDFWFLNKACVYNGTWHHINYRQWVLRQIHLVWGTTKQERDI